jgi:hypothetical protein
VNRAVFPRGRVFAVGETPKVETKQLREDFEPIAA